MLTIGEFSRLTRLSVRTLRRYHEGALLEPAVVDEAPATATTRSSRSRPPRSSTGSANSTALGDVRRILRSPDPGVRATLVAAEPAVATHVGEHDGVEVTCGELGTWVVENAMSVAGPVREVYLVSHRDAGDPAAWRTEIGWPVFRVS